MRKRAPWCCEGDVQARVGEVLEVRAVGVEVKGLRCVGKGT